MKKVAVTGCLASGKSLVCKLFAICGALYVSSDHIVHQFFSSHDPLKRAVVALLGQEILDGTQLNRSKIASKIFGDGPGKEKARIALEKIIHPLVLAEIKEIYRKATQEEIAPRLFVVELPLLYEAKMEEWFDDVVVVVASQAIAQERFCKKDPRLRQDFIARRSHQLSDEEKSRRADYILTNEGSIEELREQVMNLYTKMTKT